MVLLGVLCCNSGAVAQTNEISAIYSSTALLGASSGPSRAGLGLAYHREFTRPSLRVGGSVQWQTPNLGAEIPFGFSVDAAVVFRGPLGWRPYAGMEAGWTGLTGLSPKSRTWPAGLSAASQSRVSPLYLGFVVAPLRFLYRRGSVQGLALRVAEMGLEAHVLRVELDLFQAGIVW